MANECSGLEAHSAEVFGDTRNHWWNVDYLRFLASHWGTGEIRSVLDVGCGLGHWTQLWSRILSSETRFTCIDREAEWIKRASQRTATTGSADRFQFRVGRAEDLDCSANTFDLVTCQTLLMHLSDPARGVAEMVRVAKPGGLIVVAEPTNIIGQVLQDALAAPGLSIEILSSLFRFQLVCQSGKKTLGEGDDLIGESIPSLLRDAGLVGVQVRVNDRAHPILPPYDSDEARAFVEESIDSAGRELWGWTKAQSRRYFVAGGAPDGEFESLWTMVVQERCRVARALEDARYAGSCGGLFYIAWARKARVGGI